jgi:hypothetical protein
VSCHQRVVCRVSLVTFTLPASFAPPGSANDHTRSLEGQFYSPNLTSPETNNIIFWVEISAHNNIIFRASYSEVLKN